MIDWVGLSAFRAAVDRTVADASMAGRSAVTEASHTVQARAMENASGAPGPEVETGTMRRGIRVGVVKPWGLAGWQVEVGPTVIYSRRIELGFSGSDALGRIYSQAPKPYFGPAWSKTVGEMRDIYMRNWRKGLTQI